MHVAILIFHEQITMSNPAKRWCFTINNPEDSDKFWEKEENLNLLQYIVLQEEKGEEGGNIHYQGFMILKDKKRLEWLKNHFSNRAHWEITRGTNEQARDYCRKDETYTGGLRFEHGSLPERAPIKKRDERLQDAAEELDIIKEGYKRPAEVSSITLMQPGFIMAYRELTADVLGPYRKDVHVITMIGPPGTGKSYTIQKYFPDHGRALPGNSGVWFQNPTARVMVFEEFCGQIQLQKMLQLLDPYPMALEVKGGMRPAMYTLVVITSNTRPDGWYKGDEAGAPGKRSDAILALWDRLGFGNGGYIPVRKTGYYLEAPIGLTIAEQRKYFDDEVENIKDALNWQD